MENINKERRKMRLRNKKTGEVIDIYKGEITLHYNQGRKTIHFKRLEDLEEWEDVPEEPKEYPHILPNTVRRAILSWVKVQDNPIEKISILLKSYYDTNEVDSDGFYDYEFYGYVGENNKNLVANTLSIRLKKPFKFDEYKDYTLSELGIMDEFGGEE